MVSLFRFFGMDMATGVFFAFFLAHKAVCPDPIESLRYQ